MKEIIAKRLGESFVVFVDDEDYEMVSKYKWHIDRKGYVRCYYGYDKKVFIHRMILGLTDPQIFTDHIDHNPLNNQKYNLRPCSHTQNMRNKQCKGKIPYKGVSIMRFTNKVKNKKTGIIKEYHYMYYQASIRENGKCVNLGTFKNPIDAAVAYDNAAIRIYGEFAWLNKNNGILMN